MPPKKDPRTRALRQIASKRFTLEGHDFAGVMLHGCLARRDDCQWCKACEKDLDIAVTLLLLPAELEQLTSPDLRRQVAAVRLAERLKFGHIVNGRPIARVVTEMIAEELAERRAERVH